MYHKIGIEGSYREREVGEERLLRAINSYLSVWWSCKWWMVSCKRIAYVLPRIFFDYYYDCCYCYLWQVHARIYKQLIQMLLLVGFAIAFHVTTLFIFVIIFCALLNHKFMQWTVLNGCFFPNGFKYYNYCYFIFQTIVNRISSWLCIY